MDPPHETPSIPVDAAPEASSLEAHIMPGMSKYDFVKIRVHLGSHYYVMSRFLVSRMLQVTSPPSATYSSAASSLLLLFHRFSVLMQHTGYQHPQRRCGAHGAAA
jgi:hypothetical protein